MNKTILLIAMALLCAIVVSALQISTPTITGARGTNASATFTIYNDGPSSLNNFQITSTADSKYQISFQNAPVSLNSGQNSTVTIQGFVPVELVALQLIGNINVKAYGNSFPNQDFYNHSGLPCTQGSGCGGVYGESTVTAPIYMQPSGTPANTTPTANTSNSTSALQIVRVRLTCDSTKTVSEGSTVKASVNQKCTMTVKLENTGNIDINDITIDADAGSDIDTTSADITRLRDGKTDEATITFEINSDAEGSNDVELTAEGDDDDGKLQKATMSFAINVQKPNHDLTISKLTVSPQDINACEVSSASVYAYVENNGKKNEKSVAVELSIPGLGFTKKISDLQIDKSDDQKVAFTVPVSKSKTGSFQATATSFYDDSVQSGSKSANIVITKCAESIPAEEPRKAITPVVAPPPRVDDIVVVPPKVEQSSFFDSGVFTALLVVGNIVVLTVLGLMGYFYFRKKPEDMSEQFVDDKNYEDLSEPKDYY